MRISKYVYKRETGVTLLRVTNEGKHHYCVIKDITKNLDLEQRKNLKKHLYPHNLSRVFLF